MVREEEYAKTVAKNLKRLLYEHEKTQADLSRDLGIAKTTVNGWIGGKRTPKMPTIDLLCQYFGCERNDIIEKHDGPKLEIPIEGAYHLSPSEVLLVEYYRHLNANGKERALTALDDLTRIDRYSEDK